MQQVILLGRQRREEVKVNLRKPLRSLTIVHRDVELLNELRTLEPFIRRELNVKEVHYDQAEESYIRLYAKANFPVLGKRFGKRMKDVAARIAQLTREQIEALQETGAITLDDETFSVDEIQVLREAKPGTNAISNRFISIDLDCALDADLIAEGIAREAVNRIQRSRKELNLNVADRIAIIYSGAEPVVAAIAKYSDYVAGETLATRLEVADVGADAIDTTIDNLTFRYRIEVSP
jgi:isoleucyl-tRNA synthetase